MPNYIDKNEFFSIWIPNNPSGGLQIKNKKIYLSLGNCIKKETGLKKVLNNKIKNIRIIIFLFLINKLQSSLMFF